MNKQDELKCPCNFCTESEDFTRYEEDPLQSFTDGFSAAEKPSDSKKRASILNARDRLNNLKDLITVCVEALDISHRLDINNAVKHVLYFQVQEQITTIEKELAEI